MDRPVKICQWCMSGVISGHGARFHCPACAKKLPYHGRLTNDPQYMAFNTLFNMKLRLSHDPLLSFYESIIATCDTNWEIAKQDHSGRMRAWMKLRKVS